MSNFYQQKKSFHHATAEKAARGKSTHFQVDIKREAEVQIGITKAKGDAEVDVRLFFRPAGQPQKVL